MHKSQEKYYPFKVRIKNNGDNFYLIEEIPTKKEEDFIDKYNNDWLHTIYLDIPTLECSTSFSKDSLEEIIFGNATFSSHIYSYEDVSFSIFGTDRKFKEIDITIYPCSTQYQGYGDKDGFTIDVIDKCDGGIHDKESVHVGFYINESKFQKIKNLIEKNLIKSIQCKFSPKSDDHRLKIDGLYLKSEYKGRNYKFLLRDTQIINKKDLPDTFKVVSNKFYELPFEFDIKEKSGFYEKHTKETVMKELHTKVSQKWIKEQVPTSSNSWRHSQKRWLMEQFAALCIAETIRTNGKELELEARLLEVLEILDDTWYETASKYNQDYRFQTSNDETEPDKKQKEKIEVAHHIIWQRRDPRCSFNEGFESKHYFEYNKESFYLAVTAYLKRQWLRHPVMDWIFMDMMITSELCLYGEDLKQKLIPGKKDWLLGIHHKYLEAKGNIKEMKKINWNEYWKNLFIKLFWAIGAPVVAILAAFHYELETTGIVIISIYALIIAIYLATKGWLLVKPIINTLLGKPDPRLAPFQLWESMYQVWQSLEGSVINPTILREQMQKTTKEGAIWNALQWVLIDKIIKHDPAMWIVEQSD